MNSRNLESVSQLTTNSTCPTGISSFLDRPVPPPPTAIPSVAFNVASTLSLTCYPHPLPSWIIVHLNFVPTCQPPASAACLCVPRRVPASFAISCVRSLPLVTLGLCPGPFRSPGVLPSLVSPCICIPSYLPPRLNFRLYSSLVFYFFSPRVAFFACEDNRPGNLHSLTVSHPIPHPPLLNGPAGVVKATWIPPNVPPPPRPMYS